MRRLVLIVLFAAVSVGAWAQTPDKEILSKEEMMSRISALEAQSAPHLDTVTAVVFNEEYITGTLWVNDFADMMKAMQERPMDTTGWEDTLEWLLPESDKDSAQLAEASAAGIYIDVKADGNAYGKYVQRFKSHGFNSGANETEMSGMKLFEARNAEGNRQGAVLRYEDGSLTVSIETSMTDEELMNEIKGKQSGNRQKLENEFEALLNEYL